MDVVESLRAERARQRVSSTKATPSDDAPLLARVQQDALGLFVEHDGWICRPVMQTELQAGQAVHAKHLYGQSISLLRHADAIDVLDVWLRCGRAAQQSAPHEREALAKVSLQQFSEDVWWLREMALVGRRLRRHEACQEGSNGSLDAGYPRPHHGRS